MVVWPHRRLQEGLEGWWAVKDLDQLQGLVRGSRSLSTRSNPRAKAVYSDAGEEGPESREKSGVLYRT